MTQLVYRNVEAELKRRVRVAAAEAAVSEKEFVVGVLWKEVLNGSRGGAGTGNGDRQVRSRTGKPEGHNPANQGVQDQPKGKDSAPGEPDHSAQILSPEPIGPARVLDRHSHDSENCRVRGCGMCKVLGVKDSARGLK